MKLNKIGHKAKRLYIGALKRFISWHLGFLSKIHGASPIPIKYWAGIRNVLHSWGLRDPDILMLPHGFHVSTGISRNIPELQDLMAKEVLGEWSLDAKTVALLWDDLCRYKPRLILECGAGISTLMLAAYAAKTYKEHGGNYKVISLEQDQGFMERVEDQLKGSGLSEWVQLIYAPLDDRAIYDIDSLGNVLTPQTKIDWILVDGPAGPPGCRFHTLPIFIKFCRTGARWFLDDAFRDAELGILGQWDNLPDISVEGIYPVGKGLAKGFVV